MVGGRAVVWPLSRGSFTATSVDTMRFSRHMISIERVAVGNDSTRILTKRWYNLDVVLTDDFPRL